MRTQGSRKTYVALVDDDESLCRSMARLLRAAGMQVSIYPSAEAFLADSMNSRFDCLLLDIQLQGMSGLELQMQVAASGLATPVIFITAHDEPLARDLANAAGCAGFYRKSDSGGEVIDAIRRAVSRHRSR